LLNQIYCPVARDAQFLAESLVGGPAIAILAAVLREPRPNELCAERDVRSFHYAVRNYTHFFEGEVGNERARQVARNALGIAAGTLNGCAMPLRLLTRMIRSEYACGCHSLFSFEPGLPRRPFHFQKSR